MATVHFWYEFASTYSYLSAMRIDAVARARGVEVVWRPFLLGPIFQAQGLTTSPFNVYETKGAYMWRDLDRRAQARGLPPVVRPDPFPQNGLLPARLAILGHDEGWGRAFTRGVFLAEFGSGITISDPDTLSAILLEAGADPHAALPRVQADQTIKDRLRANTEDAAARGLFGAPSFTTEDGELFWGDDRLEDALDWAKDQATGNPA